MQYSTGGPGQLLKPFSFDFFKLRVEDKKYFELALLLFIPTFIPNIRAIK